MTSTIMEKATRGVRLGVGLAAAVALLAGAAATATAQASNPSRCEALKLKKESAYYECLSRCERRAARGRVEAEECEVSCQARFDAAVFRVDQSAPCQPAPEPTPDPDPEPGEEPEPRPPRSIVPDPQHCEARLLQIQARHLLCRGRCAARAGRNPDFDLASCEAGCDARCQTAIDTMLARPVCGDGRVASGGMRPAEE